MHRTLIFVISFFLTCICRAEISDLSLAVAPQTLHSTEVTLFWNAVHDEYEIFQNQKSVRKIKKNFCTIKNLTPNQEYQFSVKGKNGEEKSITIKTPSAEKMISVKDHGAVGDGKTLNTKAIQAAIDACPKGGIVLIPEGEFLSGALFLKSDMILEIAKGGTLKGSQKAEDYMPFYRNRFEGWELDTYASLINAGKLDHKSSANVKNISIRGEGTISGGGNELAKEMIATHGMRGRGRLFCIMNAENIEVQGIKVEESPCWTLHFIYSKNITCHDLNIISKARNGDGLDPDSSKNFYIMNCDFNTGDDCIAVKSGKNPEGNIVNISTENVWISGCRFEHGHGLSIGSEISGGIKNIFINDCVAGNLLNGLQIKATKKRGAIVENIHVKNCDLQKITILTNVKYNDDGEAAANPPIFRNFHFSNIDLTKAGGDKTLIEVQGFSEKGHRTQNVSFDHINLPAKSKINLSQAENISFSNITTADKNPPSYKIKDCGEIKK